MVAEPPFRDTQPPPENMKHYIESFVLILVVCGPPLTVYLDGESIEGFEQSKRASADVLHMMLMYWFPRSRAEKQHVVLG